MIFKNSIPLSNGILTRGDQCLFRGAWKAIYMGSYKDSEKSNWRHILKVQAIFEYETKSIDETLVETDRIEDIVCIKQQEQSIEGQM